MDREEWKEQIANEYCGNNMRKLRKICNKILKARNIPKEHWESFYDRAVDIFLESINSYNDSKECKFNTQKLREKLPEFLAGLDGNFDAMIITGDFRYAPEKENNPQKVVDYINLLCEKLRWTDTPKVITVPGNHDLDRGSVRTAVIRSAKDKYQPNMGTFDPELLGQLLGGFNFTIICMRS